MREQLSIPRLRKTVEAIAEKYKLDLAFTSLDKFVSYSAREGTVAANAAATCLVRRIWADETMTTSIHVASLLQRIEREVGDPVLRWAPCTDYQSGTFSLFETSIEFRLVKQCSGEFALCLHRVEMDGYISGHYSDPQSPLPSLRFYFKEENAKSEAQAWLHAILTEQQELAAKAEAEGEAETTNSPELAESGYVSPIGPALPLAHGL